MTFNVFIDPKIGSPLKCRIIEFKTWLNIFNNLQKASPLEARRGGSTGQSTERFSFLTRASTTETPLGQNIDDDQKKFRQSKQHITLDYKWGVFGSVLL